LEVTGTQGETLVEGEGEGGSVGSPYRTLARGDVVGRYVVLESIGVGGMGMVYAAYDPELDRRIALKLVRPGRRGDPAVARTRLMREAQAMARLSDPHVITVHDVGDFEGQIFVAMEYIQGSTLSEWRAERERSWRSVVSVMRDAGSGLAAAHRAGLVHRDFKPDNVMVAEDGRVLVMDFGLARAASLVEEPSPPPVVLPEGSSSKTTGGLSTTVTRDGALVGTPAYMAPEQHVGLPTGARTDQFSFGVALHECLYSTHPFGGSTVAAIANAVTDGNIRPPPRDTEVPAWVRRIVLRALSVKAAERYESMDALVEELGRDPTRSRNRVVIAAVSAGALLAAVVGAQSFLSPSEPEICTGAEAQAAEVYDSARAKMITSTFLATELSYAGPTAERVNAKLDDHVARWSAQHERACKAGQAGEHSDHVLDLRMACLQRDLEDVAALVDVLTEADKRVVARAADAVDELAPPEICGDVDALLATEYPPPEAEVAAAVQELQAEIPRVRALYRGGKPKAAHALAVPLVEHARATAYGPVLADALNLLGHLQIDLARYLDAERTLEEAVLTAMANRSPMAADAAVRLAWVVGTPLERPEEALRWSRLARAEFDRSGADDPLLELRLLKNQGEIHQRLGDSEAALEHARNAVAMARRDFEADHPAVYGSLQALGAILVEQGKYAEGHEILREATSIRESAVGKEHPSLGSLLNNLGAAAEKRGELDEAIGHLERAHEIKVATYGPDHPTVGFSENNLSATLVRLGRYELAIERGRRALTIWEKALGPEHRTIAYALANIGRAELELGRPESARASLLRAMAVASAHEANPDLLGEIRFSLARSFEQEDPRRAFELAAAAREDYVSLGDDARAELGEVEAWLDARR
jgi:tetratricopeptide (TPR) repeat protein/predicted Ser/Thr protein kinase